MKTLQDVAKVLRKEASKAIYPGVKYERYKRSPKSKLKANPTGQESRAFAKGNLLTKFISSPQNALNRIGSKVKNGYQFVLTVSPEGASYGRWVHYGTTKMDARPFAELGAESKEFRDALDELMEGDVEATVETLFTNLDNELGKAGFKIS
jgi:hypothetical protein